MPSPFPGMDPWLESPDVFPDVHDSLIFLLKEALNARLPPGYAAISRTRVWVDPELTREPDVAVYGRNRPPSPVPDGGGTLTGLVAVGRRRASDPDEEPYLEIRTGRGKRLVTAVEIISRANKQAGKKGRESYREKQEEYALGGVNLVEIDLLRDGPHVSAVPLARLRRKFGTFDYHVSVMAVGDPPTYHAAGIRLADRLPAVGIPLAPKVPEVVVDLQPLLDAAYDRSRYTEFVDYRQPPDPPLTPDQQTWADAILRTNGLIS